MFLEQTKIGGPYILLGQSKPFGNGLVVQMGIDETEKKLHEADTNNHTFVLDFKNKKGKIDSNTAELEKNIENVNYNYYLFAKNKCGTADGKSKFKMNYCKISNDDSLIHYFIPCYSITAITNADGNPVPADTKGLYDLVEGKFYTNANTAVDAVDFIAGPEV